MQIGGTDKYHVDLSGRRGGRTKAAHDTEQCQHEELKLSVQRPPPTKAGETFDRAAEGGAYELDVHVTGEAFLTPPGPLSDIVCDAVEDVLGVRPELSTSGGTSDSRFIKDFCPVLDFGLIGATMHKSNEQAEVADIEALSRIYEAVLRGYFDSA